MDGPQDTLHVLENTVENPDLCTELPKAPEALGDSAALPATLPPILPERIAASEMYGAPVGLQAAGRAATGWRGAQPPWLSPSRGRPSYAAAMSVPALGKVPAFGLKGDDRLSTPARTQRYEGTGVVVAGDGRKTYAAAVLSAAVAVLSSAFPGPAQAAERVALVIGNAAYARAPALANPLNDAAAVGAALARLGYSVTRLQDADYETLRQGLGDFAVAAQASEVALVFYAGHGIEVDKHNFLVPVDAELASDQSVEYEAVRLELVTNAVRGASALRLVILDACRENPFAASMRRAGATRSVGRGLGRVEPAGGTIVAYAAKEGTVAADGEGLHSPYTTALLRHLEEPGLDVGRMLRRVRDAVLAATGGRQEPVLYGSLPGRDVYLSARAAPPPDPASGVEPEAVPARTEAGGAARAAYEAAERAHTIAAYQAVVKNFPGDFYADLARARIEELKERVAASMGEKEDMTEASPESSVALAPASLPADEETPLDAGAHADRIEMSFIGECWLEVYNHADEPLFYGLAQSGDRIDLSGRGPIRIVLGNSDGVEVRYNGAPVDFSAFTARGVAFFSVGGDPPTAFQTPDVPEPAGELEASGT